MRLCPVKDLEDDMILGKSIYQLNGKLLLGAGFRITPQMKAKLVERGYTHVYIMEEGTEDVVPEELISDSVSFEAKNRLASKVYDIQNQHEFKNTSVSKASELIDKGSLKDVNISQDMRKIVEEMLKDVSSAGSQLLNSIMIKTADTYFIDHALNVSVLSILLGKRYRFSQKELLSLGLGAFLHDIGKVVVEQMNPGRNSAKNRVLYREHPTLGYMVLNSNASVSPLESQIVNQHHENQDGTGFPIGLKGDNLPPTKSVSRETKGRIFRLAEICSIADAFDNLTCNPRLEKQLDPIDAIKQIILKAGTKYNKDIVKMLLKVVPFYPVGATVKVVDVLDPALVGFVGVVAKLNNDNINKPIVILTKNRFQKKIKPIVVNTSSFSRVELKLIL